MVWMLPIFFAHAVAPRITEVSLFQNGYAFVRREMDVTATGEIRIEPLPQTVLGTFRFASTPGVTIQSVLVDEEVKSEPSESDSLDELLALNVGRPVTLVLTDNRTLNGLITRASSSMTVTFQEGTKERVLPRNMIREILVEGALNRKTERKSVVRSLRIRYEATKPGKLILRSLEPGLGWTPSYEATLLDDRNLRLQGRATVANDLAELDKAEAELVTGSPNVSFSQYLDPLVGEVRSRIELRNLDADDRVAALESRSDDRGRFNAGIAIDGLFRGGRPTNNALVEMPATGQGLGTVEELFRHRLAATSLRKGARAQFTLFDVRTEYRELFTWDVQIADAPQSFWRTIRFANVSGRPLAAGPASTFRDEQLLGQDLLRSTAVKEETELRLTQAADVRGEALEAETERVAEPGETGKPPTIRVTVRGTLRITNGKDRSAPVRIRRTLLGQVTEKDGATERRSAVGLRPRDPVTELTWTLDIPAGQTKTINYVYRSTLQQGD